MKHTKKLDLVLLVKEAESIASKHPDSNFIGRLFAQNLPEAYLATESPGNAAKTLASVIPFAGGPLRRRMLLGKDKEEREERVDNASEALDEASYGEMAGRGAKAYGGLGAILGGLGGASLGAIGATSPDMSAKDKALAAALLLSGGAAGGALLGAGGGAAQGLITKFLSNRMGRDSKERINKLTKDHPYLSGINDAGSLTYGVPAVPVVSSIIS